MLRSNPSVSFQAMSQDTLNAEIIYNNFAKIIYNNFAKFIYNNLSCIYSPHSQHENVKKNKFHITTHNLYEVSGSF
jgi:hypothetical protein